MKQLQLSKQLYPQLQKGDKSRCPA